MNLKELLLRTAAQIGEDELDDESRFLAHAYISEAYEELMHIYKPFVDIDVDVPEDGILPRVNLGPAAGRIIRATVRGVERPFDTCEEGLLINGAAGLRARIRCRYIPPILSEDGDEPELPRTACGSLADFASYRLMQGGGRARQQRGEVYFSRYLQRKATLAPEGEGYRDRIANKY